MTATNPNQPLRPHSLRSAEFVSFCIFSGIVGLEMLLKFVAAVWAGQPDLVLTDRDDKLWLALGAGGVLVVRQVAKGITGYGDAMKGISPQPGAPDQAKS